MLSYMAVQSMSQSVEADISHSSRQVDLSHSSQQVDVKPVARITLKRQLVCLLARRGSSSPKHQNNHWEDSGDEMAESSKGQRLKQKSRNLFDDADDDTDASVTKRRKTEQSEKNQHNREFDSEAFDLTSKFRDNNRSDVGDGDLFDVGDGNLSDWDESEAASADRSKDSSRKAASADFTCSKDVSREAEQENTHNLDSNGGSSKNLLRDSEGRPLTNLCQIEVVDLIAKRDPSRMKSAQSRPSGKGQPNFKRFKKTQNAGSGRLPTIIGGSDLEVHLGSKHQNIEDLFSASLAQENERQEKDLRDADLFNWDERTRKTSNKRIR
ncbi:unnamed protein product [Candidula unifasciata]|uniref:Nibrin C-terminal domain-containing protein n=1 Tax=Candidula unifasciata TaxID=100452 RepID=A0A8S3YHU6_9EUPU|nr:unnamed protein product [Candidula unifasciata]